MLTTALETSKRPPKIYHARLVSFLGSPQSTHTPSRRIRELEDSGLFELAPEDSNGVNASRLAARAVTAPSPGAAAPRRASYDARSSEHSGTPAPTTRERTYSSSNPVLV